MHDRSRITAARILLVPLLVFLLVQGIIPAFTIVQSDFPNYYTAGLLVRTGAGVEHLYDDDWFQEQIERAGISQQGKFSPFPPPTALLFIPLSLFDPLNALRLMTLVNIVLLCCAVAIVRKVFAPTYSEAAAFVLLAGVGLSNGFRLGQLYIALSLAMLLGLYFQSRRSNVLAGVSAGLLLPVKYFSIILLVDAALRKNLRMVGWGMLTSAFIMVVSVGVLGWDIHWQFLHSVLGEHLTANLTRQNPYSPLFQSFDSLLRRLFVFDGDFNAHPLLASAGMYQGLKSACILAVVVTAAYAVRASHRHVPDIALAVLTVAGLLVAPATATYHYVLLWLPVGIMLRYFRDQRNDRGFFSLLVCYAAIGFIPYSMFLRFDGEGVLTLLAYPRLMLLIATFVIVVLAAVRVSTPLGDNAMAGAPEGGLRGS